MVKATLTSEKPSRIWIQTRLLTLSPADQRPRKIVIRGIPSYSDPQLNIDAPKKYDLLK